VSEPAIARDTANSPIAFFVASLVPFGIVPGP
jgi:hypothetical protein